MRGSPLLKRCRRRRARDWRNRAAPNPSPGTRSPDDRHRQSTEPGRARETGRASGRRQRPSEERGKALAEFASQPKERTIRAARYANQAAIITTTFSMPTRRARVTSFVDAALWQLEWGWLRGMQAIVVWVGRRRR